MGGEYNVSEFNVSMNQFFFDNEYLQPGFANSYFDFANIENEIGLSQDQHEPKNPLFYYSTKEQQKQGSDIPEKIEVNFNIAYGEGKESPTAEEFNKNILSCYIKIQSGKYENKYIKFTPKMNESDAITIERDDKLYSYGDKDMTAGDKIDFAKLAEGDLPELKFKINNQLIVTNYSQEVVGYIEEIFHSSPTFDAIQKNDIKNSLHPSLENVQKPKLSGGGEQNLRTQ